MNITVVCVLWNPGELLPELVETLKDLSGRCRIELVDNGSTDGTVEDVSRLVPEASLIETGMNGGFGWGNNRALERVETPFTLLLNSDARIDGDSLDKLLEILSADPGLAAVQPVLRSWEWPLLCVGEGVSMTRFGEGYDLRFLHLVPGVRSCEAESVPGVSAAVSLWRTAALREAGGFDENIFMYYEDVDLCMRLASAGWRFAAVPCVTALHRSGASSSRIEALTWELASSVYLTRRYFGSGRRTLPLYWRRRELRIRLSSIRRGAPWSYRPEAIRKGKALPCNAVTLQGEFLSMLESRPMDLPMPRSGESFELDGKGLLRTGPGFSREGGRFLIRGYGCIDIPGREHFHLDLRTCGCSRSGALLDPEGEILGRFNTGPEGTVRLDAGGVSGIYLSLDERDAVAEVLDVSVGEETG